MTAPSWRVTLAPAAAHDLSDIVRWTAMQFGDAQARRYGQILRGGLGRLRAGPKAPGTKPAGELPGDLRRLPVGRHILFFRVVPPREIQIARILHAAMDPARHLGPVGEPPPT